MAEREDIMSLAGTMMGALQSGQYMVETWQVVVLAAGILVTVLTLYGTLIRRNYDIVSTLNQRLLGADGDGTDEGFLRETSDKLDNLGEKMDDQI